MNNSKIANIGEDLAVVFLQSKKHHIIQRNIRYRAGEIDIISKKGNQLIFTEVKTRKSENFGLAEESFNQSKRSKMKSAVYQYIFNNQYEGDWQADLITITIKNKIAYLRHYVSLEL
jgi:putative endonuclease